MLSHLLKVEDGISITPAAGNGHWLNMSQQFIAQPVMYNMYVYCYDFVKTVKLWYVIIYVFL